MRWSFQGMVTNELTDNEYMPNGKAILEGYGFGKESVVELMEIVVIFPVIFLVWWYLCLRYINFEKR